MTGLWCPQRAINGNRRTPSFAKDADGFDLFLELCHLTAGSILVVDVYCERPGRLLP